MAKRVVVIGAGIGGLTAGALLAKHGYQVTIFDQALVPGGCASTFKRRGFTFDVGATQVAGLEPGGIHDRIFRELGIEPPAASPCEPACAVYLPGENSPINVWRDPEKWHHERLRQFPGSERFWQLLQTLFQASWQFQARNPVLPPRSWWDLGRLLQAVRPDTLVTAPFALMTVGDVLRLLGLAGDRRLRTFLDLQLKLYSQVNSAETALLYAATALSVSQAPQGLFHLHGSMQSLSDRLLAGLTKHQGRLMMRHTVTGITTDQGRVTAIQVKDQNSGRTWSEPADHVVANVTVQDLIKLLDHVPPSYQRRVTNLPPASGAFVIYLGVAQAAIPSNCPPHLQFLYDPAGPIGENNSLFVSVSQPEDGRAPAGQATITASSFTDPKLWWGNDYQSRKAEYTATALAKLGQFFHLAPELIRHIEAATPRTFNRFTARDRGIVGGIGQRLSTFGPFGIANRTPCDRLWLTGDSTHPGEGTAGVSYSALTVVQQILASD